MLKLSVLLFSFLVLSPEFSFAKGFIPTSDLIYVAEQVAQGEGYSLADRHKFFFDLVQDTNGKKLFPGYLTVGFYRNSDLVITISINEDSGQVLDIDKCILFEYPRLQAYGVEVRRATGAAPFSVSRLQKLLGCDTLTKLTTPKAIRQRK